MFLTTNLISGMLHQMAGVENPQPAEKPLKPLTVKRAQVIENLDKKANAYFEHQEIVKKFPEMVNNLERREAGRPLKALYLTEDIEGETRVTGTRRVGYVLEGEKNKVFLFENGFILVADGSCPKPDDGGEEFSFSPSPVPIEIPVWERNKGTDVDEVSEYFRSNMVVVKAGDNERDVMGTLRELKDAITFSLERKRIRESAMVKTTKGAVTIFDLLLKEFDSEPLRDIKNPPKILPPVQE
jgi:hypothetical protein